MIVIADVWSAVQANELLALLVGAVATLSLFVLVLMSIKLYRETFGRNPPMDEDLRRYSATVEELKRDLARLPDDEKFGKLAEQLSGFATIGQLAALEVTLEGQMRERHNEMHGRVHNIEGVIHVNSQRLAAQEAELKLLMVGQRDMNVKIDKIVARVGDKVEQLIRDGVIRGDGHRK